MKKTFKHLAILLSSALAFSCSSDEDIFNSEDLNGAERRIAVIAEDFTPTASTRTEITETENGYSFKWTEGDVLGVFPTEGYQTAFPISQESAGSNTALFDGGKWALRPNESYAAYYPLQRPLDEVDKRAIPVSYLGQVQNGNSGTSHLAAYDYLATSFTKVNANGSVNLKMKHLGCLVQFVLKMPKADTFSNVEIVSDNASFITEGYFDLTATNPSVKAKSSSKSFSVKLENVSTSGPFQYISVNVMLAPVDFSASTFTVKVYGSSSEYKCTIPGKNLAQGSAYVSLASSSNTDIPYITFEADAIQYMTMTEAVETLEYSVNGGEWKELAKNLIQFGGDKGNLRLRGKNQYGTASGYSYYSQIKFATNAKVKCTGDIRTLLDYENYANVSSSSARYCYLFKDCVQLISAPELPTTSLASSCYWGMFSGCTSLTTAPELPATTLASECYRSMFSGCTSLTTAPELPATTLASNCYSYMFFGCESLTQAPELPANTLALQCYYHMFSACTSLTQAPELPATALDEGCYRGMFENCKSLTQAPELPATTLAKNCYSYMFFGCESLTQAPELPATTLAYACYSEMFYFCYSLTQAPKLPATTLAKNCYSSMFSACTSLKQAPELPATTLADDCYGNMFNGCTSLTTAPNLQALILSEFCYCSMFSGCTSLTTAPKLSGLVLSEGCYSHMFSDCTSLTTAPELLATMLPNRCYEYMFYHCTKLSYIKMMATNISSVFSLSQWTYNVAATGTFVKNAAATWDESEVIPEGWTVVEATE